MRYLLLLLVVILAGCAGTNGGSRYHGVTPYVGQWSGTWRTQDNSKAGSVEFTVDNKADMLGVLNHPDHGMGTIDGWCDTDGEVTGSIRFSETLRYSFKGDLIGTGPIVANIWVERTGEPDTLYIMNVN
jgi:hypothetical protein